jgi:hypothetical protein
LGAVFTALLGYLVMAFDIASSTTGAWGLLKNRGSADGLALVSRSILGQEIRHLFNG